MTDNKLTDNEIIKALEYCINYKDGHCENCPYRENEKGVYCVRYLAQNSLDLINRQKAEIERYEYTILEEQSECDRLSLHVSNLLYELENTRAEVIKEYREKAAIKLAQNARSDYWHWIDDTLHEVEKEMVGENNV